MSKLLLSKKFKVNLSTIPSLFWRVIVNTCLYWRHNPNNQQYQPNNCNNKCKFLHICTFNLYPSTINNTPHFYPIPCYVQTLHFCKVWCCVHFFSPPSFPIWLLCDQQLLDNRNAYNSNKINRIMTQNENTECEKKWFQINVASCYTDIVVYWWNFTKKKGDTELEEQISQCYLKNGWKTGVAVIKLSCFCTFRIVWRKKQQKMTNLWSWVVCDAF